MLDEKMTKITKSHVAIASVILVIAVSLTLWSDGINRSESEMAVVSAPVSIDAVKSTVQSVAQMPTPPIPDIYQNQPTEIDDLVNELVAKLVNDHAHEKHELAFQVSLTGLRNDLLQTYPEQGQAIFERILRAAFPDLADDILALVAKKGVYDDWLLNNMLDLNEMNLLQQKGALWEKRYEVFGKEDAEAIWQLERDAEEERREAVQTTLAGLNDSRDISMQDRVFLLKSAYDESYFGTIEDVVLDSKGVLSQAIFTLDAVQEELDALPPETRQEEINSVRRLLGFEEHQIEWLAQRDQEREKRWQNGYAYMEERTMLASQYQGEVLEEQLDVLRTKYFKEEASTIKKEEEMLSFFRYERPRVYGRN